MTLYQRLDGTMSDNVRNREETTQMLKTAIEELFFTATAHDSDVVTTSIPIIKSPEYDSSSFKDDVIWSIGYIFEQNDEFRDFLIPKEVLDKLPRAATHYLTGIVEGFVKIAIVRMAGNGFSIHHITIDNIDVSDYVSALTGFRQIVYDLANPDLHDSDKAIIKVVVSDGCRRKYFAADSNLFQGTVSGIYGAFGLSIDRIYHTKTAIEIHQD